MVNYKKMYKKENSNQFFIKISQIKEMISGMWKELKEKTYIKEEGKKKNKSTNSVWEIKDK